MLFQCDKYHLLYIVYKLLWAVFWSVLLVYDWTDASSSWLIYLTNWSFLQIGISAFLQFLCAIYYSTQQHQFIDTNPVLFKISWVVYNYSSNVAVLVTLVYWLTLYEGQGKSIYEYVATAKPVLFSQYFITALCCQTYACGS